MHTPGGPAMDEADRQQGREPSRRRRQSSRPSPWRGPFLTIGVLAVLVTVSFVGLRAARADVSLPGTSVAGVDVGGLDQAAVTAALADVAQGREGRTVIAQRAGQRVESHAAELGYVMDVDATVGAVMERGRQPNVLEAFRDQVRSLFSPAEVAPVEAFDPTTFDRWISHIADALALHPVEGDVVIVGGTVDIVEPEPGETIDVEALEELAFAALNDPADSVIEVPTVVSVPSTSPEDLAELARLAELAISSPVTLVRGDVSVTFDTTTIARLLQVSSDPPGQGLRLKIDPDRLLALLPAEDFATLASEPSDARFALSGGQIQVIPSRDGFAFDAEAAATQLLDVATGPGARSAELAGDLTPPELSTEDAQALGIIQEVSSFTTQHPCCQSRVTNIQRMADLVDGTIVRPGETFSLNGAVGERTAAAGFVGGGAISGGEFVEQIGGGVSQFTTTMFNTIYFGGYQIVAFKPHSYYISRYPEGREATLNFSPPVDLKFTNDSPYGIYIDTSYTDTSITVTFYSTTFADVQSTTGDRYGFREPEVRREETDELPAGEERVLQSGRQGFSVNFTRTITYVDGRSDTQQRTTTYLAEPRIIQVGTGSSDPAPATAEPSAQPTSAPTSPPPTAEAPEPAPPAPAPAPTADPAPQRPEADFPEDPTGDGSFAQNESDPSWGKLGSE